MTLLRNVQVAGRWYGPAHGNADDVPPDVASRITSRAAWGDRVAGDGGEAPREPAAPAPADRPKGNAGHDVWAAYRVAQGVVTADEAEELSRDELRDMDN